MSDAALTAGEQILVLQMLLYWAEVKRMLHYALVFLVIAIVAAIFGFGGIAVASAGIAKILFYLFLIAFHLRLSPDRCIGPRWL